MHRAERTMGSVSYTYAHNTFQLTSLFFYKTKCRINSLAFRAGRRKRRAAPCSYPYHQSLYSWNMPGHPSFYQWRGWPAESQILSPTNLNHRKLRPIHPTYPIALPQGSAERQWPNSSSTRESQKLMPLSNSYLQCCATFLKRQRCSLMDIQ